MLVRVYRPYVVTIIIKFFLFVNLLVTREKAVIIAMSEIVAIVANDKDMP